MNIISDFSQDIRTVKPKPGSYEWWYFDAISTDGYSIVIIFYDGNPFSRKYIQELYAKGNVAAGKFPAISISVYNKKKPVFYSFEEFKAENADYSQKNPVGYAGQNSFYGQKNEGKLRYVVRLNQTVPNGDNIKGTLTFFGTEKNLSALGNETADNNSKHTWNLILPLCEVTGNLEISGYQYEKIEFSGTGYHDHNTGSEPMKNSFDEWYWGRYHTSDAVFVYYLMREKGSWKKRAWMIMENGEVLRADRNIEPGALEFSVFGLSASRKIEFKGDEISAVLQKSRVTDNGPFYRRYEGEMLIKRGDKIVKATGISEYILPSRIYNRLFWPLVDMRIKYPGKAHWVQKNSRLYRWTW